MTNPDRPNLVSSETLERLRTAGFSEHEIDALLARVHAATLAARRRRLLRRRLLRRSRPQRHSPGNKRP